MSEVKFMSREALKAIRQPLMSLEKLSEATGISVSQLSRFESGEREPRLSEAARISTALSVDVLELFPELLEGAVFQPLRKPPVNGLYFPAFLEAVEGSYHMLGLDQDESAALLKLVLEVAQEPPTPSAGPDFHRVQSEREVRRFLKSTKFQ